MTSYVVYFTITGIDLSNSNYGTQPFLALLVKNEVADVVSAVLLAIGPFPPAHACAAAPLQVCRRLIEAAFPVQRAAFRAPAAGQCLQRMSVLLVWQEPECSATLTAC